MEHITGCGMKGGVTMIFYKQDLGHLLVGYSSTTTTVQLLSINQPTTKEVHQLSVPDLSAGGFTKIHMMVCLLSTLSPLFRLPRWDRRLRPKRNGAHHAPGAVLRHIFAYPGKHLSLPYWNPPQRLFLSPFTCGRCSRTKGRRRPQQADAI